MFGHRLHHLGIIGQPHNHVLPPRQLEPFNRPIQPGVQLCQRPFCPFAEKPTHRREQEMRGKGHGGKADDKQKKPERKRHIAEHRRKLAGKCRCVKPTWMYIKDDRQQKMPQRSD